MLRAKALWRARLRREIADQDGERRGEKPKFRPDNGTWLTEQVAKNKRISRGHDPPLLGKGRATSASGKGKGNTKSWFPVADGNSDTEEQRKLKEKVLIKMPKNKLPADTQRQRARD